MARRARTRTVQVNVGGAFGWAAPLTLCENKVGRLPGRDPADKRTYND